MSDLSQELAKFMVKAKWEDLSAPVVREVKHLLMDGIGCALAAITTDKGKMSLALARRLGGLPESSVIGVSGKVSCSNAALTNGELMLATDYDPIMPGGHATTDIIPPSLAIAESVGASGKDLILANALGYEITARISAALQKPGGSGLFERPEKGKASSQDKRGMGAQASFGSAAGAGKLLKLDQDKMVSALGMAGHLCKIPSGTKYTFGKRRFLHKYAVPGWQGTGVIMAVLLAEMGYMGDTTVFDPEIGFWKFAGHGEWHPDKIMEDLGKTWTFMGRGLKYKSYPCCGHIHTPLDCLYSIIDQNNLMPEDIESIEALSPPVFEFPAFTNREVNKNNISDAQFNVVYVLSVATHRVRIGVEWQEPDTMTDPKILEFMKKITIGVHPNFMEERHKDPISDLTRVTVVAKGKTFTEERKYFKGSCGTDAEMTEEELVEKFKHNASRILTQDKIQNAINALLNLEKLTNISEVMKHVTP